jgi:hypothetical protein
MNEYPAMSLHIADHMRLQEMFLVATYPRNPDLKATLLALCMDHLIPHFKAHDQALAEYIRTHITHHD